MIMDEEDNLRVILIPKDYPNFDALNTFTFKFNDQAVLLGSSKDTKNVFQIVQVGATDHRNSWFFAENVIEDGRMFGILKVLKGWIFLSLFSKCQLAKTLFLTVEDVFSHLYDNSEEDPVILEMISGIFRENRSEIEEFLKKLMPSKDNLEGDIGFKFEEEKIVESIFHRLKEIKEIESSEMPCNLEYFEAKWSSSCSNVIILDNLQLYLPSSIFKALCSRFSLNPASLEEVNKKLKISESMLLKTIKHSKDSKDIDSSQNSPTDDYTKFEGKLKAEKVKNSKFAVTGNTSMLNFFKKSSQ